MSAARERADAGTIWKMGHGSFTVRLAKEDFKFSAAHFTVFDHGRAELLHGHNYRVEVEVEGPSLDPMGFLVDFGLFKAAVRSICAALDTRTLIPGDNPHLSVTEAGDEVEVSYAERRYVLPAAEVRVLPIVNTTVEVFARFLWHELRSALDVSAVERLAVSVEETGGQRCWYSCVTDW